METKSINNKVYKVYGIIITYKPNVKLLKKCVESLINQCVKLYIIDNTPNKCSGLEIFKNYSNVEVIYLYDNYGIAYAQNLGIKKALKEKADYILLSDQDTIYPENFIENMLNALQSYNSEEKVIAIAPTYLDVNRNKIVPFIKLSKFGFKKFYVNKGLHEISQAIASGLIIVSKYLKDVGLMNEKLFLYWVDLEWCWRAIYKGFKLLGNAEVYIIHKEGNIVKKILWKSLPIRSPQSHYYIIRNGIYLGTRCPYLKFFHRLSILKRTLLMLIGFLIFSDKKIKNFKYTFRGFYHGIIGKLSKLNEKS